MIPVLTLITDRQQIAFMQSVLFFNDNVSQRGSFMAVPPVCEQSVAGAPEVSAVNPAAGSSPPKESSPFQFSAAGLNESAL